MFELRLLVSLPLSSACLALSLSLSPLSLCLHVCAFVFVAFVCRYLSSWLLCERAPIRALAFANFQGECILCGMKVCCLGPPRLPKLGLGSLGPSGKSRIGSPLVFGPPYKSLTLICKVQGLVWLHSFLEVACDSTALVLGLCLLLWAFAWTAS